MFDGYSQGAAPRARTPVVKKLAVKYDVTPTQIVLGWGLSRGISLATQSKNELHKKQTLNVCFLCCSVSHPPC